MRDAFIARRDYILNDVFGERLPFLDDNPPILENLSSLEKLTAKARATVNDLLRASNLPFHAEGDAATAYLHVPASQVRAFAAAMSEANVIAYKEAHR